MIRICLLALPLAALPLTSVADVAAVISELRAHGCHGSPGAGSSLRDNPRLDAAARRLARGDTLQEATERAGYRSVSSAAVRITNVPRDGDIERVAGQQLCSQLGDRELREMGSYRHGPDVWLVLAAPFRPPQPQELEEVGQRVLELTNLARSHARLCGSVPFPAAPPLTLAPALERAALEHSRDMAAHGTLDHTGHDGSSPAERVARTGYKWRMVGENLASGVTTAQEAVNGWVASPHHCENLMNARFTQMAVAYAVNASSAGGIFWTQVFGTPR